MKANSLKNCISTLERVRDVYSGQLDACVLAEIDDVIKELKRAQDDKQGEVELGILSFRALQVIDLIVSLVTNVANLMK